MSSRRKIIWFKCFYEWKSLNGNSLSHHLHQMQHNKLIEYVCNILINIFWHFFQLFVESFINLDARSCHLKTSSNKSSNEITHEWNGSAFVRKMKFGTWTWFNLIVMEFCRNQRFGWTWSIFYQKKKEMKIEEFMTKLDK